VLKIQQFEVESTFLYVSKLLNCGFDVKITSGNISISPPNLPDVGLNPMKYQA